jgi:methylated-DNA-protein-cysteine methyltransferase-like protein
MKKIRSHMAKAKSGGNGKKQSGGRTDELQPEPVERIWQVVAMIPTGRVASYGQIASLAGMPRHARLVGRTLRELPKGSKLPWHRVVNASLKISQRPGSGSHREQKRRLLGEGVEFVGERIPKAYRWEASA